MIAIVRAAAVAASLFALAEVPAHAQTSQGLGSVSCGQFLKAARSGDILYHQASSWLMGYASGLKAASGGAAVTLTGDQLIKSAGDYCEANPGGTLAQAASGTRGVRSRPRSRSSNRAAIVGGGSISTKARVTGRPSRSPK